MTRFHKTAAVILTALFAVTAAMPVQAHHADCPAVCGVAGCTATGLHSHDGCDYYTSSQYAACGVEDCTESGVHVHNDITYAGCRAPAVCGYEDCASTCAHMHDGTLYGAHYAGDGHSYCQNQSGEGCYRAYSHYGRHHGRRHH